MNTSIANIPNIPDAKNWLIRFNAFCQPCLITFATFSK